MIMWELMTGRRPFWDQDHDTDLIIRICDGLHPPIVTNAPKSYIELMQECWNLDPKKRPTAADMLKKIEDICRIELENKMNQNPTKIIKSPDIRPLTTKNPGAIYKSRPLSKMVKSAGSTRNLSSRSITLRKISKYFIIIMFYKSYHLFI